MIFSQPIGVILAVGAGGALGALARFFTSQWLAVKPGEFPIATLIVNLVGAFLMGIGYVLITQKMLLPPITRQIFMVGFLGALTTFSTFSLDAYQLWQAGNTSTACLYILSNVVLSLLAVSAAIFLTEKLV